MSVEFINSEMCEIDGRKLIFFREPFTVFKKINDTVQELGGEKFYSSTDPNIKKVRESLAEVFFLLALRKYTDQDWFLMQPEAEFPDFFVVSMNDGTNPIGIEGFELTEIPPRCEKFEKAMKIVNHKLLKGYPPSYSLLIFVNNIKSTEWIPLIHKQLGPQHSFKEIWTLHFLTENNNTELGEIWANRISPNPVRNAGVNVRDPNVWKSKAPPSFTHLRKVGDHTFLEFDTAFIKAFRKFVRSMKKDRPTGIDLL